MKYIAIIVYEKRVLLLKRPMVQDRAKVFPKYKTHNFLLQSLFKKCGIYFANIFLLLHNME